MRPLWHPCATPAESRRAGPVAVLAAWLVCFAVPAVSQPASPPDLSGAYAGAGASVVRADDNCRPRFVAGIGVEAPTQVLVGRNTVVLADAQGRSVRLVHLDAELPTALTVTRQGYSIGHWDGDTLVVETTGLPAGRPVVERFRRVAGGSQLESIVDGRATLANGPRALRTLEPSCSPQALVADASRPAAPADAAVQSRPLLEGSWKMAGPVVQLRTRAGQLPPLKPSARQDFQQHHAGLQTDTAARDKAAGCRVLDEPRASFQSPGLDIVQGADTIFVGYASWARARFVPLGDSFDGVAGSRPGRWRAHWDRNSLVLEGEGFDAALPMDASGLQHSAALRVVQHLTLKQNGRTLEIRSVFTDVETFSRSWETVHAYQRQTTPPEDYTGC